MSKETNHSLGILYPEEHIDEATGIISLRGSHPIETKGPFSVYRAYLPEDSTHILLLVTSENWAYHAHKDEEPKVVIRNAIKALRKQTDYVNQYRWYHLVPMFWYLCTRRPSASREDTVAAGNCTAGADKWFADNGYSERTSVSWYEQIKHIRSDRSRMVAWYQWQQSKG